MGLFGQMLLVDGGKSLGTGITEFKQQYFFQEPYNLYSWFLREGAAKEIVHRIKGSVHTLPDYRDTLPPMTTTHIKLDMPKEVRVIYDTMKTDMLVDDIEAVNAAVKVQKLQQIASGFLYDTEQGDVKSISNYRIDRLVALLNTMPNERVIICYWYQEELRLLQQALPKARTLDKKGLEQTVSQWNSQHIKTLLVHPRSCGHGLNLAQGGNVMVWLAPQWSNDLWLQTCARIWRRGQTKPVNIIVLEAKDSIDELVSLRVDDKSDFDVQFNKHLKQK